MEFQRLDQDETEELDESSTSYSNSNQSIEKI